MPGIFGIVLLGIGVLFFAYRLIQLYRLNQRVQASQTWPQISGAVTEAHVRSQRTNSNRGRTSRHYYAEVDYAYEVMGVSYPGKLKKDKAFTSQQWAQQVVDAYPPGTAVPLRYNPEKPQEALSADDRVRGGEVIVNVLLLVVMLAMTIVYALQVM